MAKADIVTDKHAMEPQPLAGCEPCAYWSRSGCLKCKPGYPDIGDWCRGYEREPGVEGKNAVRRHESRSEQTRYAGMDCGRSASHGADAQPGSGL